MKKSLKQPLIFSSVLSLFILSGSFFMNANAEKEPIKTPGSIVIGLPPACDCTAPASTCYCITNPPPPPPPVE